MTARPHPTDRSAVMSRAGAAVAREVLEALDDLPGLAGACVFDVADGTVHAARDGASRPPASLLSWAAHAREVSAHRSRRLEDVIITSTDSHHLLRALSVTGGTAWVYLQVDARRGNLALTRRRLARVATDPEPRTRPTPRAPVRPALGPGPGSRPGGRPALPAAGPPAAAPLLAPTTPTAPVRTTPAALAAPATTPPDPDRAAGMPALAMLSPLDESWAIRRPTAPTATPRPTPPSPPTPTPTPTPVTVEPATASEPEPSPGPVVERVAIPAPRRVLTQRPRIQLVEPPTVPPPPAPGGEVDEQADARAPEDDPVVAAMLAEAIARAAAEDESACDATEVAAPAEESAPDAPGDADGPDGDRASGEQPDTLPTRTPGAHGAQVPSPRAPSQRSGWGTDGGTLRRLLVGLRRLA